MSDVDRERRIVSVQRVYANGKLKEYAKTHRSGAGCRSVGECSAHSTSRPRGSTRHSSSPGPEAAISTSTTSANATGSRRFRAAGLEYRWPYDLRHTYATFSIAAGVSLFALARRMGTSLEMIDRTYGHLSPDADEYELGLLDAFDARVSKADGHFLDTAE